MRGKVVLVRFPFDDLSAVKVRPAVCLTEPVGFHQHVVVAFVTSRVPDDLVDSDLVFRNTDPDFAQTGLRVTSTLRLHRLVTVTSSLLLRELGLLSAERLGDVQDRLRCLFGLPRSSE